MAGEKPENLEKPSVIMPDATVSMPDATVVTNNGNASSNNSSNLNHVRQSLHEAVEPVIEAQTVRIERLAKVIGTIGLGSILGIWAIQYFITENKLGNAFLRDQVIKDGQQTAQLQAQTTIAINELANTIRNNVEETRESKRELNEHLDKVVEGQQGLIQALHSVAEKLDRQTAARPEGGKFNKGQE
jgi:uncharacterized protein HemX